MMNRRYFLGSAIGAAAAVRPASANNKVSVGVIGLRGQGKGLAARFAQLPDTEVAYLCDVDQNVLERIAGEFEKRHGKRPKLVSDMRRIFDDKEVHAVVVATPDHWHAPAGILACAAGKDLYVEKPCSHNIREGRLLVEAARRYGRIVQHGTQNRSNATVRWALDQARSGRIGKLLMAKAWNVQLRRNIGRKPDSEPPPGVDYDTWIGPAQAMPFNENRFHYEWHWWWNYGTGDMGNDGVHQLDIAVWAMDAGPPERVSGMGKKLFFDDDQQTPDTMNITYEWKDKVVMFEMRIWSPYMLEGVDNGVGVYGTEGMIHIGRWKDYKGSVKFFDRQGKHVPHTDEPGEGESHHQNFVNCVRSRNAPNAEIAIGHASTIYAHLGNMVARTGRSLKFDAQTESIVGDAEAQRLVRRDYRKHWGTPTGV